MRLSPLSGGDLIQRSVARSWRGTTNQIQQKIERAKVPSPAKADIPLTLHGVADTAAAHTQKAVVATSATITVTRHIIELDIDC